MEYSTVHTDNSAVCKGYTKTVCSPAESETSDCFSPFTTKFDTETDDLPEFCR